MRETWQCRILVIVVVALGVSASSAVADDSGPKWIHDFDKGKRAGNSANKDVVVVFTGRGWCQPCELLDQMVFEDQGFVEATAEDFVFVELDFNFGDTKEEKDRESKYGQLKDEYLVPGFPTIVLMDAHGLPFATMVGYSADVGPDRMVEKMKSAQKAKNTRDDLFRKAESIVDERERVMHLHGGIQSVETSFGTLEEHGDDPVLAFYGKHVDEILNSSHDAGNAIRSVYIERSQARDAWVAVQSSREEREETLRKFRLAEDYRGAIDYIDSILADVGDADVYWNLQISRLWYLQDDGDHEGALRYARQLLKSEDLPERIRESLLDSEARSLFGLERSEEAIALVDKRIAVLRDDAKKKLRLLGRKASWVGYWGSTSQLIEAWQAHRDFATPKTFEWLTGTVSLARAFKKAGQHRRALPLFRQVLGTLESARQGEIELAWPWSPDRNQFILLEAAECHIALEELSAAKALIDQAAADIDSFRKSVRVGDKEWAKQIQEKAAVLRARLDDNTPEHES